MAKRDDDEDDEVQDEQDTPEYFDEDSKRESEIAASVIAQKQAGKPRVSWKNRGAMRYNPVMRAYGGALKVVVTQVRPVEAHCFSLPLAAVPQYDDLTRHIEERYWNGEEASFEWKIYDGPIIVRAQDQIVKAANPEAQRRWKERMMGEPPRQEPTRQEQPQQQQQQPPWWAQMPPWMQPPPWAQGGNGMPPWMHQPWPASYDTQKLASYARDIAAPAPAAPEPPPPAPAPAQPPVPTPSQPQAQQFPPQQFPPQQFPQQWGQGGWGQPPAQQSAQEREQWTLLQWQMWQLAQQVADVAKRSSQASEHPAQPTAAGVAQAPPPPPPPNPEAEMLRAKLDNLEDRISSVLESAQAQARAAAQQPQPGFGAPQQSWQQQQGQWGQPPWQQQQGQWGQPPWQQGQIGQPFPQQQTMQLPPWVQQIPPWVFQLPPWQQQQWVQQQWSQQPPQPQQPAQPAQPQQQAQQPAQPPPGPVEAAQQALSLVMNLRNMMREIEPQQQQNASAAKEGDESAIIERHGWRTAIDPVTKKPMGLVDQLGLNMDNIFGALKGYAEFMKKQAEAAEGEQTRQLVAQLQETNQRYNELRQYVSNVAPLLRAIPQVNTSGVVPPQQQRPPAPQFQQPPPQQPPPQQPTAQQQAAAQQMVGSLASLLGNIG
jgi:hypothetical protein